MAFRSELLSTHRWSGHLIEDAEFQMELLLDGVVVEYVPGARIAAEMPAALGGATTQNERWELGRIQLAKRFVPQLLRMAVTGGPLPRRTYLDGAADHSLPPMSALAALDVAAVGATTLLAVAAPSRSTRSASWCAVVASGVLAVHVLAALRLVGAPASVYRALASAPQLVIWKLGLLKNVFRRPDNVTWTRTTRNAEQPAWSPEKPLV